jgi:hypothetical protein
VLPAQSWTVAEVVCIIEGISVLLYGGSLVAGAYGHHTFPFHYFYFLVSGVFGWSLFTTLMLTVWLREQVNKFNDASSRPPLNGSSSFWRRHRWLLLVLLVLFPVSDFVVCASTSIRLHTPLDWDFTRINALVGEGLHDPHNTVGIHPTTKQRLIPLLSRTPPHHRSSSRSTAWCRR